MRYPTLPWNGYVCMLSYPMASESARTVVMWKTACWEGHVLKRNRGLAPSRFGCVCVGCCAWPTGRHCGCLAPGSAIVPRLWLRHSNLSPWLGDLESWRGRYMQISCHDFASVFSSRSCIKVCPNLGLSVVIPKWSANKLLYLLPKNW